MRLVGSDLFFKNISIFGPWSGDILINGSPKVIFIALKPKIDFTGASTWSWYIPITTSNLFNLSFKKIVSAGYGPETLNFFERYLIAVLLSYPHFD